ncbi:MULTISPECIES: hypothetical protein [Enterobacter cloacae complex]|uniref:hypothetical protein n=1 Tax=Enterobacter cloacae complex TaxID=354276 RepID=UPI00076C2703|nr:hypothetical protein [Enterobacter cloacae]KVI49651.1 hypothetical protein AWS52_24135 [Enterobacter cloacae subsp. cloacae]
MAINNLSRNIKGEKFGSLLALSNPKEEMHESGKKYLMVLCACDCGNEKSINYRNLIYGKSKTCGCSWGKNLKKHGDYKSLTYGSWQAMLARCNNKNNGKYFLYGGRGISVCERWAKYENFLLDMGERPSKNHSIDRIDVNKGYSPENCRWASQKQQCRNKRDNRFIATPSGEMTVAEAAEKYNLNRSTIFNRLARGKTDSEALLPPKFKRTHKD